MNQKPENGDNLKNWTIEELNQTINNFIKEKNQYYLNTKKKNKKNQKKKKLKCPSTPTN